MWAEFEWENKVAVNTAITEPLAFLDHIIASTNMVRGHRGGAWVQGNTVPVRLAGGSLRRAVPRGGGWGPHHTPCARVAHLPNTSSCPGSSPADRPTRDVPSPPLPAPAALPHAALGA